ncbi:lipoyl(octanoyl) transferase LipB [Tomitella fengzijianii]|uniref:Octanoyltransferase n=1 Tax=Tomitella fengzijianii TaxID=2597660 RepID=A0A516X4B4_9ACTN|nr:lipoyl(octanoyl) transferase LipB [Tomitella fengzijianii]QDQ97915.1 lipoyl(octanoyl) transferase LipB [Tomitella fengzijianii]
MRSVTESIRSSTGPVIVSEWGSVDYLEAWDRQRAQLDDRAADGPDSMLLLEHPAVYTAGRRTLPEERPEDGTPVIDVDRGGKITWHGPGQLVGYPIIGLAEPVDVVEYVRRLEQALISVCTGMGVRCGRVPGRSGVWLPAAADTADGAVRPERKIAAIGIRVERGITMHGFALNCDADLTDFSSIIPCGITDAGVTSLSIELGRDVPSSDVLPDVRDAVLAALDGSLPVEECDIPRRTPEELAGAASVSSAEPVRPSFMEPIRLG